MTEFKDLGLAGAVLRAVENEGYTTPTPIQAAAIPYLMEGRDLLGIAQTGTGKTAAFALPILTKLVNDRQRPVSRRTRALIMAPTRELASQIADSFRSYGRHAHMQIATVFGGVSYGPQVKALGRGLDILVATPGRLLDHLQQGTLRLDGTEIVVLDEADHMLDLGFIVPIREIVAKLPAERQTLFFSATMPREIAKLAGEMLNNPAEVAVKPEGTTAERVDQSVFMVDAGAKSTLLLHLLKQSEFERTLIFTRTKRGADKVVTLLNKQDIAAQAIHGNKSQAQREKALAAFKRGAAQVLVATDIAARGIDVDNVSHVVNYELPDVPEAYVHRIGRTARAGAAGKAIAFCAGDERGSLRDIQRLTRMTIPAFVWSEDKGVTPIEVSNDNLRSEGPARKRSGNRNGSAKRNERRDRPAFGKPRQASHGRAESQDMPERQDRSERPQRSEHQAGGEDRARPQRGPKRTEAHRGERFEGRPAGNGNPRSRSRDHAPAAPAQEYRPERIREAWGAPQEEPARAPRIQNSDRPEFRSAKKPHRKGQNGARPRDDAARPAGARHGKPAGQKFARGNGGEPAFAKPASAKSGFEGEFTGGFTERQLNGKPNRPGQRRRRKMQAEKEAMAAAV